LVYDEEKNAYYALRLNLDFLAQSWGSQRRDQLVGLLMRRENSRSVIRGVLKELVSDPHSFAMLSRLFSTFGRLLLGQADDAEDSRVCTLIGDEDVLSVMFGLSGCVRLEILLEWLRWSDSVLISEEVCLLCVELGEHLRLSQLVQYRVLSDSWRLSEILYDSGAVQLGLDMKYRLEIVKS
jgi:hypothetical protein